MKSKRGPTRDLHLYAVHVMTPSLGRAKILVLDLQLCRFAEQATKFEEVRPLQNLIWTALLLGNWHTILC